MKLKLAFLLLLLPITHIYAQSLEYEAKTSISGLVYSSDESPFWFHSNQRGRIDETTNVSTFISGTAIYKLSDKARITAGLGLLYHDGFTNKLQFDESFLQFQNSWLDAHVGRKQREELYNGLSASNENILWSLNARPLLGLSLKTNRTIYFSKSAGLGFEASLEEFITDDERFVEDTRIHHKSFHIIFSKIKNFEVKVGLQHFVQWAGTSPEFEKLPSGFSDYIDVFTGREGNDDVSEEEANALGNHLGSYEVYLNTSVNNYKIEILYNHLFEDGSGRILRNTPDGRYGVFVESPDSEKFVNSFMYEFYYTRDQSDDDITTDGNDNYFNNNLYKSGWTYESRILGVPFITLDDNRFRINNNKVIVHHIGVSGIVKDLPYKFLASYRKNYGGKTGGGNISNNILSTYLDLKVYQSYFDINLQLGSDFSDIQSPNFGAGVQLSKKLF